MTIDDLKVAKEVLERDIHALLGDFEMRTGVEVTDVYTNFKYDKEHKAKPNSRTIDIEIKI